MVDGRLNFVTKIDDSGFKAGVAKLKGAAAAGATAVAAALGAMGAAAIRVGMEYETSMAQVGTVADQSVKSLSTISDEVLALSQDTGLAAKSIADATYQAISGGVDTASAVGFAADASKLAVGGFTDTATAVDTLTTILNAYGLEASDTTKVSDMLVTTQNLGKTTVDELASSMGKVIPTANAFGVGIDQLCSGYTIMTSKGIATAESTTYMNGMLNELGKSGTKVSDILKKKTGQSFSELMAEGASLGDVLGIVQSEADASGLKMIDLWGSAEAGKAAVSLMSDGVDGFNEILGEMGDSAGATETAYEKMSDTLEFQANKAKTGLVNLGIAAFEKMESPLKDAAAGAAESLAELTDSMSSGKLSGSMEALAGSFGGLISGATSFATKALPVVISGAATLVANLDKLVISFATVKTAMVVGSVTSNMAKDYAKAQTAVAAVTKATKGLGVANAIVTGEMTVQQAAVAVSTGAIRLNTAATALNTRAQNALSAAIAANPWGALLTIVAAGAVAIGAVVATSEKATSKLDTLSESINKQKESWEELSAASKEQAEGELAKINHASKYIEELDKLTDANGHVADADKARADTLYTLANELMPEAISKTEEEGRAVYKLADKVGALIEKKKALAIVEAYSDDYADSIKEQAKGEKKLIELYGEKAAWYDKLSRATDDEVKGAIGIEIAKVDEAIATQNALNDTYEQTQQTYENMQGAIAAGDFTGAIEQSKNFALNLEGISNMSGEELQKNLDGVRGSLALLKDELAAAQADGKDTSTLDSLISSLAGQETVILEQMLALGAEIPAALGEGINSNSGAAADAATNVVEEAKNAGTEAAAGAAETGSTLVDVAAEGAASSSGSLSDAAVGAVDQANADAKSAAGKGSETGAKMNESAAQSLEASKGSVVAAAQSVTTQVVAAMNSQLDGFTQAGTQAGTAYSTGLTGTTTAATAGGQAIATATKDGLGSEAQLTAVATVGSNFGEGFAKGVLAKKQAAYDAGYALGAAALRGVAAAGLVNSPSRAMMVIGGFYAAGMILGLTNNIRKARAAGAALGFAVIEGTDYHKTEYYKTVEGLSKGAIALVQAKAKSYEDVGKLYIDKMSKGFKDNDDKLVKQAKESVDKQYDAMKEAHTQGEEALDEQHKAAEKKTKGKKLDALKKTNEAELKALKKSNKALQNEFKDGANKQIDLYKDTLANRTEDAVDELKKTIGKMSKEAQDKFDEITNNKDAMQGKLSLSENDLFRISDSGNMFLTNLDAKKEEQKQYLKAMRELKKQDGMTAGFMDEVARMDKEDAIKFSKLLMEHGGVEEFVADWEETQTLAKTGAEEFYQGQLDTLRESFVNKLEPELEGIPAKVETVGEDAIKGFVAGIESETTNASEAMRRFAEEMKRIMMSVFENNSSSKWAKREIGVKIGKGVGIGALDQLQSVYAKMRASVDAETSKISVNMAASTGVAHANNSSSTVEKIYKSSVVEKTPVVRFEGELAQFGRLLRPIIATEIKRVGGSMIRGKS